MCWSQYPPKLKGKDQNSVFRAKEIAHFWFPQGMIIFPGGLCATKWNFCRGGGLLYEPILENPEGMGGERKNPFRGGGMDIFWNYTWWPMKTCTFPVEITRQGAQSLRMKMLNAKLNLKGATNSYLQLVNNMQQEKKLERVNCSHWFYSEHGREYRSKLCTDHSSVHFAEMIGERALLHCM